MCSLSHATTALEEWLGGWIEQEGPIPFEGFMEQCLYHPEHGFYAGNMPRLGRDGHFFTSVHTGAAFGQALACQGRAVWEALGRPAVFWFCEQGAHDGRLARDILDAVALDADPAWPAAVHYCVVEPNKAYRTAQQSTLQGCALSGQFHQSEDWHSMPASGVVGMVLCNELLDAFPVHVVEFRGEAWHQLYITREEGRLKEVLFPVHDDDLRGAVARLPLPRVEGYRTEINLRIEPWMREVSSRLRDGLILIVDYGFDEMTFYRPDRVQGTLQTYWKHRANAQVLEMPGEKDITAHINFTEVARAGLSCGCAVLGWSDQHHWLVDLMLPQMLEWERQATSAPASQWMRQFQALMHPATMGTAFHALALSRGILSGKALLGFEHSRHHRLGISTTS